LYKILIVTKGSFFFRLVVASIWRQEYTKSKQDTIYTNHTPTQHYKHPTTRKHGLATSLDNEAQPLKTSPACSTKHTPELSPIARRSKGAKELAASTGEAKEQRS